MWRYKAREDQAAETGAAHECRKQYSQGDGRRANDQFQELEPDDFVNERRDATTGGQEQKSRQAQAVRFDISDFGFEVQDLSNFKISNFLLNGAFFLTCANQDARHAVVPFMAR